MSIEIEGDRTVLWGLTVTDVAHICLHAAIVVAAAASNLWGPLYSFDPVTAGVTSVLAIEGVDILRVMTGGTGFRLEKEGRDLLMRSLGATVGGLLTILMYAIF